MKTVAQLIQILSELDPDLPVAYCTDDTPSFLSIDSTEVKELVKYNDYGYDYPCRYDEITRVLILS